MEFLSIGQLARQVGIGVETVRFYEREGLLDEPLRKPSGYRQFRVAAVNRLLFIRNAKQLGFTLKEIRELLLLRRNPASRCADVSRKAEDKIAEIDSKIRTLQRMKRALKKVADQCRGIGTTRECSILDAIDKEK